MIDNNKAASRIALNEVLRCAESGQEVALIYTDFLRSRLLIRGVSILLMNPPWDQRTPTYNAAFYFGALCILAEGDGHGLWAIPIKDVEQV